MKAPNSIANTLHAIRKFLPNLRMPALMVVLCAIPWNAFAQNDLEKALEEIEVLGSLMDEEPFDIVTLTPEATGRSVKVALIDLPDRRIPTNQKENDKLQVTILLFPDRRYEVAWKDVSKIWLYEQMILARAKKTRR